MRRIFIITAFLALGVGGWEALKSWSHANALDQLESRLLAAGQNAGRETLTSLFDLQDPDCVAILNKFCRASDTRCLFEPKRLLLIDRIQTILTLEHGKRKDLLSPCLVGFTLSSIKVPETSGPQGLAQGSARFLDEKTFFHAGVKIHRIWTAKGQLNISFSLEDPWLKEIPEASGKTFILNLIPSQTHRLFREQDRGLMREDEIAFDPAVALNTMRYWFENAGVIEKDWMPEAD